MAHLPTGFVSHSRKVLDFYKRYLRHLQTVYHDLDVSRYHCVVARSEFDKNKDIKDLRVAKELLLQAERELQANLHWSYIKFPESPGGCAYDRDHVPPDWVIDYWDPIEKSFYPKYFATREIRKKEFEKFYEKHYAKAPTMSKTH